MASNYERKLKTTGYWTFICNTNVWNADEWFEYGEDKLLYRISSHHKHDMIAGQMGVLRINEDRRSNVARKGLPKLKAGIYAIFEVTGKALFSADPDKRGYHDLEESAEQWRVPVRVVKNLFASPVLASNLPASADFQYIHRPLQTSTIPLSKIAFETIVLEAGCPEVLQNGSDGHVLTDKSLANSVRGIRLLENRFSGATPVQRQTLSVRIERGSVGTSVKKMRGGQCQICEGLGLNPIAFKNKHGEAYSEAHHVIPVHLLQEGSLSHVNIMVLCPNHHRQAHYGHFSIIENNSTHWIVDIDGQHLSIQKPTLVLDTT